MANGHIRRHATLYRTQKWVWSLFRAVLLIGLGFIILEPVIMQLSTSFKSISDLYDGSVYLVAKSPTVNNYRRVWEYLDYPVRFVNSLLYSLACSLLQLMSCTLVAYGISRFRFRGRNLILGMVIFTLVIPPQTVLLSLYFQFQYFSPLSIFSLGMSLQGANLIGTPRPLLILSATAVGFKNGLYIFMLRQHFKNVPKELEEAASIDGCGAFQTFFRVILPGAKPMLSSILLFSFVWQWNDYFYSRAGFCAGAGRAGDRQYAEHALRQRRLYPVHHSLDCPLSVHPEGLCAKHRTQRPGRLTLSATRVHQLI